MSSLKNNVDLLLRKYGKVAIHKFTCKLTQLSQFKTICKNMANTFRNNGYEEYAQIVEAHAIEVEESLLARQKYEATLIELEKDVSMITDISQLEYQTCAKALEKMKGWRAFFDQVKDMPVVLQNEQKEKINKTIEELSEHLSQISSTCRCCINAIKASTTFEEVCKNEDELNSLLLLGMNDDDTKAINECLRSITASKNLLEVLPDNIDELKYTRDSLDISKYGDCGLFISSSIENKLNDLYKRQQNWIERFIDPVMNKNSQMNSVECSNWLDRTKELPLYLSKDAVLHYKEARDSVEKLLHKNRVQGVYVMYDKLNDSEKSEFIRMILPPKYKV